MGAPAPFFSPTPSSPSGASSRKQPGQHADVDRGVLSDPVAGWPPVKPGQMDSVRQRRGRMVVGGLGL